MPKQPLLTRKLRNAIVYSWISLNKSLVVILLSLVSLAGFLPSPAVADDEATPVVLYDSEKQAILNAKEKQQNEKKEQEINNDAPSNVVFLDDEINSLENEEEEKEDFSLNPDEENDNLTESSIIDKKEAVTPELKNLGSMAIDETDVLIDMRHAHDFSDFPLTVDDRAYHRIYSFHRAFEGLRARDVHIEKYDSKDPITPEILTRCKTLFINLPSGDKEPFLVSEIAAIRDFVEGGGSLFLITDHTNCYFHQSRLTPLLHELDIEPQYYGICDKSQSLGSSGCGWIFINKFDNHPVTNGLRQIAFQTGGGVDPRYAVAWSSSNSWQDAPIMPIYGEADVAYFGNFTQDSDEQTGTTGVVLAKELKQGKIVVVADQNLFSPFFLQYLDVYRLWNNAFSWLLNRPDIADVASYLQKTNQGRRVVCWEELTPDAPHFGDPDPVGYYHIYTTLCRYYNVFCVANDDPELTSDVVVVLQGGKTYSSQGFDYVYNRLLAGKTLVVVDPNDDVLTDENSEVFNLIDKLSDEADVRVQTFPAPNDATKKKYVEMIEFTNGAKIALVRGRNSYNNEIVPKPEARLLFVQMENIKTLLSVIDNSFETAKESSDQPQETAQEK